MKIVIDLYKPDYDAWIKEEDTIPYKLIDALKNGIPLPKGHGDLIDRTQLYNQTSEWEAQALEQVNRYNPEDSRDEWRWWSAVLKERGAFKHDVADAPTIIEGSDSE